MRRRLSKYRSMAVSAVRQAQEYRRRRGPHAPLDFIDWVERRLSRGSAGFPDGWRTEQALPFAEPSRVAVLLHAFFADLVPELLAALAAIPVEFDLIVTNATGAALPLDITGLPRARNVIVLPVANHGRDIWPMVQVVNAGVLDPYELVLKVHTKRSEWRAAHQELAGSGEQWRSDADRQPARLVRARPADPQRVRRGPGPGRGHRAGQPARIRSSGAATGSGGRAAAPAGADAGPGRAALPGRIVLLDQGIRAAGAARAVDDRGRLRRRGRPGGRHHRPCGGALDRHPG